VYEKMDEEEEEEQEEKKKKRITPSLSLSKNRRCDHWDVQVPMEPQCRCKCVHKRIDRLISDIGKVLYVLISLSQNCRRTKNHPYTILLLETGVKMPKH